MNFQFHPVAEIELNEAISYYEKVNKGLGFDFAIEANLAIQRALSLPKAWAEIDVNIRRSLLARFPYGILYTETDKGIYILAVMNLHRQPNYWKHRS